MSGRGPWYRRAISRGRDTLVPAVSNTGGQGPSAKEMNEMV